MKRRIIIPLVVFLVLGVVTTVAVAWACARWSVSIEELEVSWPYQPEEIPPYEYAVLAEHGVTPGEGMKIARLVTDAFGFRRIDYWAMHELHFGEQRGGGMSGGYRTAFIRTTSGWPFGALTCHEQYSETLYDEVNESGGPFSHRDYYPLSGGFDVIQHISFAGLDNWPIERPIPLRPIWPGFAINAMFYAAMLWLLFVFPFVARRWRRAKRGLCAMCGYDLRGQMAEVRDQKSEVRCPECGGEA